MSERILSIDPGHEHCGWALGLDPGLPYDCGTDTPAAFFIRLRKWLIPIDGGVDVVLLEEWRLFPEMANTFIGSDMPTSQVIGAIKYIVATSSLARIVDTRPDHKGPMAGVLRSRKIDLLPGDDHARDAQLHLWRYLLRSSLPAVSVPVRRTQSAGRPTNSGGKSVKPPKVTKAPVKAARRR